MIIVGDNRFTLATVERGSVQCIATSPPYFGLRLYGDAVRVEIGKERDLDAYVSSLVDVMRECRRVLRDDGVAWVNLGDSYGKNGSALLVPFRVAAALQADGWTLRAMLPWVKHAAMPESVQSRPCIAHEHVLFLTKRASGYFYDADAVRVPQNAATLNRYRYGFNKVGEGIQADGASHTKANGADGVDVNPAGRSLRSSDFWRAGAREAGEALLVAADGEAVGMLTNDDHPAALVVNPKGSGIPHFAMWPARLVAPMIMAGTPEAGSCSVCGAPWERVVERVAWNDRQERRGTATRGEARPDRSTEKRNFQRLHNTNGKTSGVHVRHLGFRPSCAHADAPARPAIVLDPFAGAGTTLAVAECLWREGWGCELYQKNAELYPERLAIIRREMADYMRGRTRHDQSTGTDAPKSGQLDMFGSVVKS